MMKKKNRKGNKEEIEKDVRERNVKKVCAYYSPSLHEYRHNTHMYGQAHTHTPVYTVDFIVHGSKKTKKECTKVQMNQVAEYITPNTNNKSQDMSTST